MLFNSYEFIFLFLPLVLLIYYWLGNRKKYDSATIWLVFTSLCFYGYSDYRYVPLLLFSISFNYMIVEYLVKRDHKKRWLIFGLLGNVSLLGYYKYTGFFTEQINFIASRGCGQVPRSVRLDWHQVQPASC